MNNYCSTCLGYIASDPCDGCDGTEENHIYYEPDFVKKSTKPRYLEAEKLKRQMGLMPMDWNTRDEMWMRESDIACYIDTCPEADVVERKKGKWIITDIDIINRVWHCNCSECGEDPIHFISGTEDWWLNKLPNYCPNCGADMREEKNNKE